MRGLIVGLLLAFAGIAAAADSGAELVLLVEARQDSPRGPLAQAEALQPGLAPATPSKLALQAELHHTQRLGPSLALVGRTRLAHRQSSGGDSSDHALVNELHLALDLGGWQFAAGKKVLGWDVGYGFRPNDVVQQEQRRVQFGQTPEGRPLVQVERFERDTAWALVWANPQQWNAPLDEQRGAHESAQALRSYARLGALDLHGFARQGRHTGASLGTAAVWVAGDEVSLHASVRAWRRHDGWAFVGPAQGPSMADPWQLTTLGGGSQALLGGQWTGESGLSLLVEAWHDGTALADHEWRNWQVRNRQLALLAQQAPWRSAAAGNLAWQARPMQAGSLRRDNLFLRGGWQGGDWTLSLDLLLTPADRGRILTTSLQFKAERWRLDASLRWLGGPDASVIAQLPLRRAAVLAATRVF